LAAAMICSGQLVLKRASASRPSGQWIEDDFDVLADGVVVGRIVNAAAAPVGSSWLWTYGFNPRERQPAHGYARHAQRRWRRSPRASGGSRRRPAARL